MEPLKHRDHWRKLSEIRIVDAEILLKNGRYDAAYYLAGYAVECALKARIVKLLEGYFPPREKNLYIHKLDKLIETADLKTIFEQNAKADKSFRATWDIVKDWSEGSRYETYDKNRSKEMLNAVREVVTCIKKCW